MIRVARGDEPTGLRVAGRRRLGVAVAAFNQHGSPSEALTQTLIGYGSAATKRALFKAQYEKCAWCERETAFSSHPVDHYRPRNGAWRNLPHEPRRIDTSHYWWLAWTWSNLLFSCPRCNDQGHKGNYFPLRRGTTSAAAPVAPVSIPLPSPIVDTSTEQPLLLDPAGGEDPLDHIAWLPGNTAFNRSDWIWTPVGLTDEGQATIDILKLGELADRMQGHVRTRLLPSIEEVEQHLTAGRSKEAHDRWNRLLADNLAPKAEWSAFTWHALGHLVPDTYRIHHVLASPQRPGVGRGLGGLGPPCPPQRRAPRKGPIVSSGR